MRQYIKTFFLKINITHIHFYYKLINIFYDSVIDYGQCHILFSLIKVMISFLSLSSHQRELLLDSSSHHMRLAFVFSFISTFFLP